MPTAQGGLDQLYRAALRYRPVPLEVSSRPVMFAAPARGARDQRLPVPEITRGYIPNKYDPIGNFMEQLVAREVRRSEPGPQTVVVLVHRSSWTRSDGPRHGEGRREAVRSATAHSISAQKEQRARVAAAHLRSRVPAHRLGR